jgi:hypothetical protein
MTALGCEFSTIGFRTGADHPNEAVGTPISELRTGRRRLVEPLAGLAFNLHSKQGLGSVCRVYNAAR